jgi:autotransporter adhesin
MNQIKSLLAVAFLGATAFSSVAHAQMVDNRYLGADENNTQIWTEDLVNTMRQSDTNTTDINNNKKAIESLEGVEIKDYTDEINANTKAIDNLRQDVSGATALSVALSSLPSTSVDAPVSCGVGGGTHSSKYAVGLGCASNINEKFSINLGGSMLVDEEMRTEGYDKFAGRVGFVYKFGPVKSHDKLVKKIEDQEARIKKLEALLDNK